LTTDVVVGNVVLVVVAASVEVVGDVDGATVVLEVVVVDLAGRVVGADVLLGAAVVSVTAAVAAVSSWPVTAAARVTIAAPTTQISNRRLTIDLPFSLAFCEIGGAVTHEYSSAR
jgi:hypothetical protein